MSEGNEPTFDEKTIMDCVRGDTQEMEQVQEALNLLTGHCLMEACAAIYYRGCRFIIKREEI